jgi:hypothetical protein
MNIFLSALVLTASAFALPNPEAESVNTAKFIKTVFFQSDNANPYLQEFRRITKDFGRCENSGGTAIERSCVMDIELEDGTDIASSLKVEYFNDQDCEEEPFLFEF